MPSREKAARAVELIRAMLDRGFLGCDLETRWAVEDLEGYVMAENKSPRVLILVLDSEEAVSTTLAAVPGGSCYLCITDTDPLRAAESLRASMSGRIPDAEKPAA